MRNDLITFRSVTFAQKAQRTFKGADIESVLQRTPKELSRRGCGYCLRIRPDKIALAKGLLETEGLEFGKCYGIREDGGIEEVRL